MSQTLCADNIYHIADGNKLPLYLNKIGLLRFADHFYDSRKVAFKLPMKLCAKR